MIVNELIREQDPPVASDAPAAWPEVIRRLRAARDRIEGPAPIHEATIADMEARDAMGRAKYGEPLRPGNGRDSLIDAYREALDMAAYAEAAWLESPSLKLRMFADEAWYLCVRVRRLIHERGAGR